jgi:hypothetical protein
MNDEELERRLRDEIQRRVSPPEHAPYALRRQVEMLGMLEPVRIKRMRSPHGWQIGLLAAAAAIVAMVATSAMLRQPRVEDGIEAAATAPGGAVSMFGRVDAATAWAADADSVYLTGDAGVTWSKAALPRAEGAPGWSRGYPVFADATHGWVASWSSSSGSTTLSVSSTADGGRTWRTAVLDGSFDPSPVIGAIDRDRAWLVASHVPGGTESLFTTVDGGATWQHTAELPPTSTVRFVSPDEAWAFDDGLSGALTNRGLRLVWHSLDGGATWSSRSVPVPAECVTLLHATLPEADGSGWLKFQAACFTSSPLATVRPTSTDAMDVQILTGAVLVTYGSFDGGSTWLTIGQNDLWRFGTLRSDLLDAPYSLWRVAVPNRASAVALMNDNGGGLPFLSATFDRGQTWTGYPVAGRPGSPVLGEWVSQDDVWVGVRQPSGGGIWIYASRDRGQTWMPMLGAPEPGS